MKTEDAAKLVHHSSDFSILAPIDSLRLQYPHLEIQQIGLDISRVHSTNVEADMDKLREDGFVVHHVYVNPGSQEDVLINDKIIFKPGSSEEEQEVSDRYHLSLQPPRENGEDWVRAQVTDDSGQNPIKLAKALAAEGIEAEFERIVEFKLHSTLAWHTKPSSQQPDMGIGRAHQVTKGDSSVVIAVIDDGFDLDHPCFDNTSISEHLYNFIDNSDQPYAHRARSTRHGDFPADFHGTPVASLIFGQIGSLNFGVAPDCTFLPIKVGFGPKRSKELKFENVFKYVSTYADVVCCSFGADPSGIPYAGLSEELVELLSTISKTGGRRGNGLSIICSAGNCDAPTLLGANENINGVCYKGTRDVEKLDRKTPVYSSFPMIEGVLAVGAVTSELIRSAYSNYGSTIISAPSSNGHELTKLLPIYDRTYPGENIFCAQNRRIVGGRIDRGLPDDTITGVDPMDYTLNFGGTSAAAALVAGVVGLVKSLNPDISNQELTGILQATATRNLVATPMFSDPNLQNLEGTFVAGQSVWYGHGLVNADSALQQTKLTKGNLS